MAEWQPNSEYFEYLLNLLTAATTVNDTKKQQSIAKSMDDFNVLPEADRYLLILLSEPPCSVSESIRATAGLILKNNLRRRESLPLTTINFFKSFHQDANGYGALLRCLGDSMNLVRNTAGTVLSMVVLRLGRHLSSVWPELIPSLLLFCNGDTVASVAASETIVKICEDCLDELLEDPSQPASNIVQSMINLLNSSENEMIRVQSLRSLNCFILQEDILRQYLPFLLQSLSLRASADEGTNMRKTICQSLNLLMEGFPEEMAPLLPSIIEYMFENLQLRDDDVVALEACEFWFSLVERDSAHETISKVLPRLIRILMENIVYSEADMELEANDSEGIWNREIDRSEDIKPRHHRTALHSIQENNVYFEEGQIDEIDDDDDDEEEEEEISEWTLRKCSAATLDTLSNTFSEQKVVPIIMPIIHQFLTSSDWRRREAGTLAFGAIAEGCMDALLSHIPNFIQLLLYNLSPERLPLERVITCWTLSRFVSWFEKMSSSFPDLCCNSVLGIAHCMIDKNKKLQHASCTALGIFAERAPRLTSSLFGEVIEAVKYGLGNYQTRNLIILYDSITNLADNCGNAIKNPNILYSILPLLMTRWNNTSEMDYSLFPLLECMCSLCITAADLMKAYIPEIYARCILMIESTLKAAALNNNGETDFDFCIVALDLIGGLFQGLGREMAQLIHQTHPSFDVLLIKCLNEDSADVRQSAFAVVGDMAQFCKEPLEPNIDTILMSISSNIDVISENCSQSSSNNAVWALGELVISFPTMMAPQIPILLPRLYHFIGYSDSTVSRGYLENVAITIGRCTAVCNPPSSFFNCLGRWCRIMSWIINPTELESAWIPVIHHLLSNIPSIPSDSKAPLFKGFLSNRKMSPELESLGRVLLKKLKDCMGLSWDRFRSTELKDISSDLEHRFLL